MFKRIFLAAMVLGTPPSWADQKSDVQLLVQKTENEGSTADSSELVSLILFKNNPEKQLEIRVLKTDNATTFGILGRITLSPKEAGSELETPCVFAFTDIGAKGSADGIQLGCIAWTEGQQKYIYDQAERDKMYRRLIERALER